MPPSYKNPEQDHLIGLAIGRYVIREKLAEGGMGAVYVAVHERLPDTKKVVKVLLGEFANHPIIRARFEREATAAARLKHRYIITIDDFGVLADNQLFLMMPFLNGKSLEAHLQKHRKLNIYDTTHIAAQILVGIGHLHDQGIVHRDLKPGNIFITREDDNRYKVTLIDLGIARDVAVEATTLKTDTGISMGTPGYMAPEQYGDASNATPAADIYAVGIILWEMLTGQRPWSAPSSNMLYHLQVSTMPELPEGCEMPPELLRLLQWMLAKEPGNRPASAREVAIALASLVPAIPPHVPSGADILAKVAPEFVTNASPLDGTVRNRGNERVTPAAILWSPQGTNVPALPVGTPPGHFASQRAQLPDVGAPTVNQRPFAQPNPTPALPAISKDPQVASKERATSGKIIAIGIACAILVGVTTFLIASSSRHRKQLPAVPGDAANAASDDAPLPIASDASLAKHDIDAPHNATPDAGIAAQQLDAGASRVQPPTPSVRTPHDHHKLQPTTPAVGSASPHAGSSSPNGSPKKFDPDAVEE